jgi:hypothetical protein
MGQGTFRGPLYPDRPYLQLYQYLCGTPLDGDAYVCPSYPALRAALDVRLSALPPRQSAILRQRFGLDGSAPLSLKELGAAHGLSKAQVNAQMQSADNRICGCGRIWALEGLATIIPSPPPVP